MFEYMSMANNYEQRKIDNFHGKDCEENKFVLDTCLVTDSKQPFETAILHPFYNNGLWVILQSYDTKEEAQKGHNKWLDIFTKSSKLPEIIIDHTVGGFEGLVDDREIKIQRMMKNG